MILAPERRAEIGARLDRRLAAAAAAAARRGRPVLASLSVPLPPAAGIGAALPWDAAGEPCFFWRCGDPAGLSLAAMGAAATFEMSGGGASLTDGGGGRLPAAPGAPDRFQAAEAARRWLFEGALAAAAPRFARPRLVGGFAFDGRGGNGADVPSARLWLPRVTAVSDGSRAALTLCALVRAGDAPAAIRAVLMDQVDRLGRRSGVPPSTGPARTVIEAEPAPAAWRRAVRLARRRIGAGYLEKVVLARRVVLTAPEAVDFARLLPRLAERFPRATLFAMGSGGRVFLGATPELLLRRRGRRVASGSLAGSVPRGRNPRDDRRLARALVESKKDQVEHGIVIRAIREALAPHAARVSARPAPRLLRLENVQHLHTPVTATLARPRSVLLLAGDLHPTPAVGGYPRNEALALIRALERFDRGWYAGPVGWTDATGDGEFAVAIRSAQVSGRTAEMHVGAGIVGDSDPESELAETRTKLRAMLDDLLEI